jgi:hypothetical protein
MRFDLYPFAWLGVFFCLGTSDLAAVCIKAHLLLLTSSDMSVVVTAKAPERLMSLTSFGFDLTHTT